MSGSGAARQRRKRPRTGEASDVGHLLRRQRPSDPWRDGASDVDARADVNAARRHGTQGGAALTADIAVNAARVRDRAGRAAFTRVSRAATGSPDSPRCAVRSRPGCASGALAAASEWQRVQAAACASAEGAPAADDRRGLVDELVVLERLHHEQGEVHAAREVALEDGVARRGGSTPAGPGSRPPRGRCRARRSSACRWRRSAGTPPPGRRGRRSGRGARAGRRP